MMSFKTIVPLLVSRVSRAIVHLGVFIIASRADDGVHHFVFF